MQLVNLSCEPEWKVRSWLPRNLVASKVVFFPDACPGKSPLPTGTAVITSQPGWRKLAISDCGCGMRLLRTSLCRKDLTQSKWNALSDIIRKSKGGLGDLGGGNHFLDAICPKGKDELLFLIHTGSRDESATVEKHIGDPPTFDSEFERVCTWAEKNRVAIQDSIEAVFGSTKLVLDMNHNSFEKLTSGEVVIRKGAVHLTPGQACIIPSHMAGEIALCKATEQISETLYSMSHGTGRTMSRSDAKALFTNDDLDELRDMLMFPESFNFNSLRTEAPFAYRDLDECLGLVSGFVDVVEKYEVLGYIGYL